MGAVLAFVGRCMLASLFVLSGCMKFSSHAEPGGGPVVKYMEPKLDYLQEQVHHHTGFHLPLERDAYPLIALTAGVLEVVGGGLFVFNSSLGALLLMLFLVPTTFIMHNFWVLQAGTPAHQIEFINFMKNICLLGAFLMYLNMPSQRSVGKMKRA
eukprot:GHUV01031585.1.p1 GENE.GHUV01031585.1~~GHUV01031585.1.p1  ORF type:complete len:155 (+),score=19.76 GHUV01031585.1:101-565(+)